MFRTFCGWFGLGLGLAGLFWALGLDGFAGLWGEGFSFLLFDKCIGRKRDVGGGVLAGLWRLGWLFAYERRGGLGQGLKRPLTVTFRNSSRF